MTQKDLGKSSAIEENGVRIGTITCVAPAEMQPANYLVRCPFECISFTPNGTSIAVREIAGFA